MSLLQMSFSGAVLILVIAAIRAVAINRLPKKMFLILWGVVLFRLLIPYTVPSAYSVYTLINLKTPVAVRVLNAGNTAATKTTYLQMPISAAFPQLEITSYEQKGELKQLFANKITTVSIWLIIWFVGMILCAAFFIISYFHWRFAFQTALPVQNDFVSQWQKTHTRKRPVCVKQSDKIDTPLTYGIFKPVILLPKKTDWEDTAQLKYILLHEYVHICRYDSAAKLIATFALCIHWFNPLVWVMYALFQRDLELACDERVVRSFGEASKSTYARMLIDMEARKSGLMPLCNNFSKNAIEERITAIMKIKRTPVIVMLAAAVLIVGVTTVFATSAAYSDDKITDEISKDKIHYECMDECGTETGSVNITSVTNAKALKMREAALENAAVITLLPENQTVTILAEENEFYHVSVPSDDGSIEGWVKKEYVDVEGYIGKE